MRVIKLDILNILNEYEKHLYLALKDNSNEEYTVDTFRSKETIKEDYKTLLKLGIIYLSREIEKEEGWRYQYKFKLSTSLNL
jgi:predicted transcriptional regulator